MKKFFTLLFAVGMFAMAQAQPGTRDNRQEDQQKDQRDFNQGYGNGKDLVINNNTYGNDDRYDKDFSFGEREKNMQIARINREYDYKIQKVQRSFFLNRFEKQRQIRFLQEQRQWEINKVLYQFRDHRGHHNDHSRRHW